MDEKAILFPVSWARTPEINHLQSAEAMRKTIVDAGFALVLWNEVTQKAHLRFLDAMVARSRTEEKPRLDCISCWGRIFQRRLGIFGRVSRKNGVVASKPYSSAFRR